MLCAKQVKVHGNEHPQLKETADASTHKNLEYCYQFNLLELQIIYICPKMVHSQQDQNFVFTSSVH
jgi:hypothetical protein